MHKKLQYYLNMTREGLISNVRKKRDRTLLTMLINKDIEASPRGPFSGRRSTAEESQRFLNQYSSREGTADYNQARQTSYTSQGYRSIPQIRRNNESVTQQRPVVTSQTPYLNQ